MVQDTLALGTDVRGDRITKVREKGLPIKEGMAEGVVTVGNLHAKQTLMESGQ